MSNKEEESFDQSNIRNTCHYMCSSISYTNIIMLIIIILCVYHIIISNLNKKLN